MFSTFLPVMKWDVILFPKMAALLLFFNFVWDCTLTSSSVLQYLCIGCLLFFIGWWEGSGCGLGVAGVGLQCTGTSIPGRGWEGRV